MKKYFWLTCFFIMILFSGYESVSQKRFNVNIASWSGNSTLQTAYYEISGPFGQISNSTGQFRDLVSLPTSVRVGYKPYNTNTIVCYKYATLTQPVNECHSEYFTMIGCDNTGTAYIDYQHGPQLSMESGTTPIDPENDFCMDDEITLVGTYGFSYYEWQYRIGAGGWSTFELGGG
ncbi:hypothetical protein [Fulvivirga ligni]|uniref:hypothetical protein n=1 Tax=Fulvivirga ligni TaxID=2904246 RepID=UPI001F3088C9|nr:hypothetical protein [Fulvivirga ligni]UII20010.1 hypothetical protein LVD16_19380 [Fulvivirga ligni]